MLHNVRELRASANATTLSYAFVGWVFAVSGPLLILLQAAAAGRLTSSEIENWIAAGYGLMGVLTIALSLRYRQPIVMGWSISGCVLVGGLLTHATLADAIGVYLCAGVLALLLGLSGAFKRILARVPMPIVLGMVAAVFMPLAVNIVFAARTAPSYVGAALGAFLLASAFRTVSRRVPPLLWAILAGVVVATALGDVRWTTIDLRVVSPEVVAPAFSWPAIAELLVPLTLTMVVVHDAQTVTILKTAEHPSPPVNAIVAASGIGTLAGALFGSHSACSAPVMTGIVASRAVAPPEQQYAAAVFNGAMFLPFALFAPVAVTVATTLPAPLIQALGGLALVPVLAVTLGQAFGGRFRLGALVSFLVTLSNVTIASIGSPFWGLVFGTLVAAIVERDDFRA